MNGTKTQDSHQRTHVREHVLAEAAIALMNGESPVLKPSVRTHLDRCDRCAARLDELRAIMSVEREGAMAAADAAFPETRLRAQRTSILSRLAQARANARVLHFPTVATTRTWMTQRNRPGMRWLAGAAAAGLLVGLGAGQIRFATHELRAHASLPGTSARGAAGWITPGTAETPHIERVSGASEEAFLSDMELVLNKRRNAALRALDESLSPNAKGAHQAKD